jgi:hypothetical protein
MTIEIELYCENCGQPVTTSQDRNGKWEVTWDCGCKEQLKEEEYNRGLEDGREEVRSE